MIIIPPDIPVELVDAFDGATVITVLRSQNNG